MEFKTRSKSNYFELSVTCTNSSISEDVACSSISGYIVPYTVLYNVGSTFFDMSRFNNMTDVDAVKYLIKSFLHQSEIDQLIEDITETT